MDLILKRTESGPNGIFGELHDWAGPIAVTLEHAYDDGQGNWAPKIPPGDYVCARGNHQLAGMKNPFETFEITNVPGHTNILFHIGNYNDDSEGCVLLGSRRAVIGEEPIISGSREAFAAFMFMQDGIDSFKLTVA